MLEVLAKPVDKKEQYEVERNKPMPSKHHSLIQGNLNAMLYINCKDYRVLPELSVIINGNTKVPDIAIYRKEEFDLTHEEIKVKQVPLATIEILSPTQNITELLEKSKDYFDAGVKSYWLIVPPLKMAFVFHQTGSYTASFEKNDILKDKILNVEFSLSEIFV